MELYLSLHTFDFAISLAVPVGRGNAIKNTQILDISDRAFPSVISVEGSNPSGSCGSGVVIAKRSTSIFINGQEYTSLALTAGHVIGKSIRIFPSTKMNVLSSPDLSSGVLQNGFVLNDYSDIKCMPQFDPVSNIPYALPNDLGLLTLPKSFETMIEPMPICSNIEPNDQFFIAGYPLEPESPLYCSPFLKNDPEHIKKNSDAFCGFSKKVFSCGTSKNLRVEDQYLLAAEYSSTSGMSGGPAYVMRHGFPQLVGINIGGCSLPYQFEITGIIHELLSRDYTTARTMFNALKADFQASSVYNYLEVSNDFDYIDRLNFSSSVGAACRSLVSLLNMLPLAYNRPLDLSHNLSLPVWSSKFDEIKKVIRRFHTMLPNSSFLTPRDFFLELNK